MSFRTWHSNKIILSNGKPFAIRKILDIFDGKKCQQLRNKPKIMIFDGCCLGSMQSRTYGVADSNENNKTPNKQTRGENFNANKQYHANSGFARIFSNFAKN